MDSHYMIMEKSKVQIAQQLLDENLISEKEFVDVKAYESLKIFSLHNELLFLLYLAVLLFTTGAGILIYDNIDTIGHTVIMALLLIATGVSFYFSFKNSTGFSRNETDFENPVFNYLVLAATLLSGIFIGYFEFQYQVLGSAFVALLTAFVGFASAYYFDNRSALSIGITGLSAAIGISATPQALMHGEFYDNPALFYYGIALGILLLLWTEYSEKTDFKKHFSMVFLTFALHLICICCLTGMADYYWPLYALFLSASVVYFYWKSHKIQAVSIFIFVLLYGYIGLNIVLFKMLQAADSSAFFEFLLIFSPIYFIGSIFLFIRSIKQFNRKKYKSLP
ncbi:Predicted membrane protein [Flavobacterium noncentrifugens]|uniref:Predicted membrane protein n=2 Tax=Flavobacterium noncentrifugens TaxID=1128970 RepID=A0A1G8SUK7_9FLAO|nr:Predicted membrane protein [Flavobacterium noncentrifugens]